MTHQTGDEVTIWPRVYAGESRDTEAGAQPWKATFIGATTDGRYIIEEAGHAFRTVDAECIDGQGR
jgi:hypothetical protein